MNSVKTNKGTELPLLNLKGKPYLQVAHRIVWFNEEVERYDIKVDILNHTPEEATVRATVMVLNEQGHVIKRSQGTKTESKKDFNDFLEKAETAAIGRAITLLGFGTAYALADLDEGSRIIDSPVSNDTKVQNNQVQVSAPTPAPVSSGFKPKATQKWT